jgi:AbrB family looped-hinge helix DNA binding protein
MLYMYNMYNMTDKKFELAGTVTLGPKGQVVIPSDVREKMAIEPGDKLLAIYISSKKSIAFVTHEQAQKMVDKLGGSLIDLKNELSQESTEEA